MAQFKLLCLCDLIYFINQMCGILFMQLVWNERCSLNQVLVVPIIFGFLLFMVNLKDLEGPSLKLEL